MFHSGVGFIAINRNEKQMTYQKTSEKKLDMPTESGLFLAHVK
jgi:hypothetical protein